MAAKKRVIALGFFDGVHIGHSALLERALNVAEQKNLIASVITYDTHPLSLISGRSVPLINSAEDRAGLIGRIFGIDDVIILHFDRETADMPWDAFVQSLVTEFGAEHLVAGHDHRFGRRGEGNAEKLREKCAELSIGCDIIPPVLYKGVVSSSTLIRGFLTDGDITSANEYLGHPHVLTDYVRYGYRLGRTLGTPTINMAFGDGVLVPSHGVYATRVYLDGGEEHIGVTNIGTRPTVSGGSEAVTAETHILDFQGNLYGKSVRLEFFGKTRSEMKFRNTDELRERILKDCGDVRRYFGGA
ncbi:MAG: riboflavin biosynthesis protein RibF [Oscillospiraceae bacterium]|jgi:riboflavin kinase/FMN adenylyltransferase|nr:riboflavin biosynthesis protein RibF [Oscillospiraceae bacterium]